jgi:hypothetical protein
LGIGRDLESKSAIYFKAILFIVVLILSTIINLSETRLEYRIASLALAVWSVCRLYYFMFYVIENYVDKTYRFSGIYSFLRYLLKKDNSGRNM